MHPTFTATTNNPTTTMKSLQTPCTNNHYPNCFFCTIEEPNPSLRRAKISKCFQDIPHNDNQDHVLVLSGLWHIAMAQPDSTEFPTLGIFKCMARLIRRALTDREWLLRDQNIYIPYYAAHIIGSYTMKRAESAEIAVRSGVILPLIELLRGKISWVEQRVAVRALGHLASYKTTFDSLLEYEEDVVGVSMELARVCLGVVYRNFVKTKKRLNYHCDLLTRRVGGAETEDRKAEEWASQIQCWCLYLLNCFAAKERCLNLICTEEFLSDLCEMWGGLVNDSSPSGVGLIRVLCYSKLGRERVAESEKVVRYLCNLSRSSDDWQYMGIDCLLLLLKDKSTTNKVIEIAGPCLVDLVELRAVGNRSNIGEAILRTFTSIRNLTKIKGLEELWRLKVERRRKERSMSGEKIEEIRVLVRLLKQQATRLFWLGNVEEAIVKYSEALDVCPLGLRKERMVLYSNRGQCHLVLGDPDSAVRDTTRALCLSDPPNSHGKSLWRRCQAYDMKGMARESLMDCVMFINGFGSSRRKKKIPYRAARMISKQMDATWLFSGAGEVGKGSDGGEGVETGKILSKLENLV